MMNIYFQRQHRQRCNCRLQDKFSFLCQNRTRVTRPF